MSLFSSSQERRLWLWTLALVVTIYSTLGLAGSLAGVLGDRGLNAATFVLGGLLVMAAVATQGLNRRPGTTEIFVAVGVAALYVLVFTRMTSVVERSHLMEYGVVAVLIYAALTERARNGRRVPFPPLLAILITAVIGAVDEFIQTALPNRVFDPIDIVFNTAAAVMAVAAGGALAWARRRRLQRRAEPETGQPY